MFVFLKRRIRCNSERRISSRRSVNRQPQSVGLRAGASETNPHKLIAVKSSHLTRRGRSLGRSNSPHTYREKNTGIFTSTAGFWMRTRPEYISKKKKSGNVLLVLIETAPTAADSTLRPALLYLNGNFLTRFHAPS